VLLSCQIAWTSAVENSIKGSSIQSTASHLENLLTLLSEHVCNDLSLLMRKKCEQLIAEFVHERDVTRRLQTLKVTDVNDFNWLVEMRFYRDAETTEVTKQVTVKMASAAFDYGFEYLGVPDRLVQTPLTDKAYLTLTQALSNRLGGNPFGPAGTGKTETVKALSQQLGRPIVVFGCDEARRLVI